MDWNLDWNQIEQRWDKYVVPAKLRWAKLSQEQIAATRGRHEALSARVQEAYGLTAQQSEFQISEWQSRQPTK